MSDDQYYDEETETALEKVKRLFVENKVVSAGTTPIRFIFVIELSGINLRTIKESCFRSLQTGNKETRKQAKETSKETHHYFHIN